MNSRVSPVTSRRWLRSSTSHRLDVPPVRLSTFGRRAFPVSGATVWNDQPLHVASAPLLAVFRQRRKTFLFSRSYQDTIIWLICYYYHSSLLSGHLWSWWWWRRWWWRRWWWSSQILRLKILPIKFRLRFYTWPRWGSSRRSTPRPHSTLGTDTFSILLSWLGLCLARDISVPLSKVYCTYHVTDSTRAAAWLLPLLVLPPGSLPALPDPVWNTNATESAIRRPLKTSLFARY